MAKKTSTLVTHLFPHRDDVAGLWLLKRFEPSLRKANIEFVPTSAGGVKLPAGQIGIGIGRGKYDEHKGDLKDSAASLVWKDLKRRGKLPGGAEGKALAALVDDVRRGDMGSGIGTPGHFRNDTKILQTIAGLPGGDSLMATGWGFVLMDALFALYVEREEALRAIRRGTAFATKHGKGVAVRSAMLPGMASTISAELGYALVVLEHPSRRYLHVRAAPSSKFDLSRLAKTVRAAEPESEWYLHHSKRMLLHGDLVAPTPVRTAFTLKTITALIRKLYA
ncbi:MAG: hypothetical protein QY323_00980 [Patescibacteria group bacterium]|nr:MAG: hypothetical protein QY323_00980 [Patescibacteria group bacterium]